MIKRTKQIDIFIAKDGKEFYNQKDCIYYEKELEYKVKTSTLFNGLLFIVPFMFGIIYGNSLYIDKLRLFFLVIPTGILSITSLILLLIRIFKR